MEENKIEECLAQLVQDDLRLKRVVGDLQKGQCTTKSGLMQLEDEAKRCIKAMRNRLEELSLATREEESELRQREYLQAVDNYRNQLSSSQSLYRRVLLESKQKLERNEKDELLAPSGDDDRVLRQKKKENAAQMSTELTENMLSLSRLLHRQLERSEDTMDHLALSSGAIKETHEEYKSMTGHIGTTSRLINKFDRREMTNRILMFTAFLFFFVTCAYIVIKRIF